MIKDNKKLSGKIILKTVEQLHKGESVTCPLCEKGKLRSVNGDPANESCFVCDCCQNKLNIN